MIRHIVLVRFRKDAGSATVNATFEALKRLKAVVPGIRAIHVGANISPEGLGRGYSHAFTVDFDDEAARDRYLADEDHAKVGAALVAAAEGGIEGLAVVDFEVEERVERPSAASSPQSLA